MATQEQLWPIYQVQVLDARLASLERTRASLDDGSALAVEVGKLRRAVAARQEAVKKASLAVSEAEMELASLEAKAQRIQDFLYSGKVSNPKELQGYEAELQSLGRRKDALEEHTLALMEQVDAAQSELADAEQAEAEATTRWKRQVLAYRRQLDALDTEKDATLQEREAARAACDPQLLEAYDLIQRRQGKPLVGLLEQDTCGACGLLLPGRMIREYKSSLQAEMTCPTCGAHLLWRTPES